ncbi:Attractin-like protein 1 [Takifugu flavidus]|uniref:Attractin-like protein 1 n=1 Tax=Takifugu flavidus TaxID=433684 RepID=A0A5C6PFF6_9TELE|nr:Attractin-like protein 1 [Takifugu flavidus]
MAVFVYMSTPPERVIPYLCALAAQQAALHTLQSACFPQLGALIMEEVAAGIRILQHELRAYECLLHRLDGSAATDTTGSKHCRSGCAETHSHGAVLGEQSGCSDGSTVSTQSPIWNTATRTVWDLVPQRPNKSQKSQIRECLF